MNYGIDFNLIEV